MLELEFFKCTYTQDVPHPLYEQTVADQVIQSWVENTAKTSKPNVYH